MTKNMPSFSISLRHPERTVFVIPGIFFDNWLKRSCSEPNSWSTIKSFHFPPMISNVCLIGHVILGWAFIKEI